MPSVALKIRIDTPKDDNKIIKRIKKWILQYSPERMFFVRENVADDNFHVHGFVLCDAKHKLPKIRASLKKIVFEGVAGITNGHYSLGILKPEEPQEFPFRQYETYLCKGATSTEPCNVVRRLTTLAVYTDEFRSSHHDDYWVLAQKLKKRKVRMYDECLESCKKKRLERREEIARVVTDAYLEAEKPMNIPTMRGLTNLLYAKVCPDKETAMSVLIDMIMERRDIGR